ncbi:MAG TPA: TlpA disulfide reductase family protein [Burkholderiales bacterium]|nr:TlpA disulfide reductase family protein [Burkholderiales bacterium]
MKLFFALLFAALTAQAQPLKPWSGAATPALELASLDGKPQRLADYRGRVVLVNFWATWCAPCLEEMPSIERLRRSLDDRSFAVLAVNVGEGPRIAGDFAAKMGLGFNFLLDRDMKTSKAWGARVLPATFIVDPQGKVRYSYYGAIDWSRADVREAITKLIAQ